MKKIAVFVMTVCFLFCLPALLPAEKTFEIKFAVVEKETAPGVKEKEIDMGEKYAYAVPKLGSIIKWTCDDPFALVFEEDAPFEIVSEKPKLKVKKPKSEAIPNHIYKYTLVVFSGEDVVTLDPIIIIIPPKR